MALTPTDINFQKFWFRSSSNMCYSNIDFRASKSHIIHTSKTALDLMKGIQINN